MALTLTEEILGELIRGFQTRSGGWLDDATCLEVVAQSFGLADPLALLAELSDNPPPPPAAPEPEEPVNYPPIVAFWRDGMLTSFITDYSSRRQPVVATLSGRDSIIVLSSAPQRIFEIAQDGEMIDVLDLGPGPWSPAQIPAPLGRFATPTHAFDHLCQIHHWEWSHSLAEDVC